MKVYRGCGAVLLLVSSAAAQTSGFEQRGFLESQTFLFPQTAPNDSAVALDQALFQWDATYKPAPWFRLSGSFDARADTHRQVDRQAAVSLDDRRIRRPALDMRLLSAQFHKGFLTLEIGRQLIRWGRTDILTPTDRFTPRDYLTAVIASDPLAVNAVRATLSGGNDSLDLVWQPWFTPSRIPLFDQRWNPLPSEVDGLQIVDAGAHYPGGSQEGARWNHVGGQFEFALAYFRGFNNLPLFETQANPAAATLLVERHYANMQMAGGDLAWQFPWVTVAGEAGYFRSSTPGAQDYVLYVVQLERQVREWMLTAGYTGSEIAGGPSTPLQFLPDLEISKSFVGRASLTIDVNRSISIETAVRGGGSFVRAEYSQAIGNHWRITPVAAWLRGDPTDFLGQYRRNSYLELVVRYSF
jgi:hypothetical protein